jgi:hypothetical protein
LIGVASRYGVPVIADPTLSNDGDAVCAFAKIDAMASEDAPYFTNRRRENFCSVANGCLSYGT